MPPAGNGLFVVYNVIGELGNLKNKFEMVIKGIELYPLGFSDQKLADKILRLEDKPYSLTCDSPKNSCQLLSDFDEKTKEYLINAGAEECPFSPNSSQSIDFDFSLLISDRKVVFEIEKANKEKLLYDFLKMHVYLDSGADTAVLICPHNWPHARGKYELFSLAKERFELCRKYGMMNKSYLDKMLLVGFSQTYQGEFWDTKTLLLMKESCKKYFSSIQ